MRVLESVNLENYLMSALRIHMLTASGNLVVVCLCPYNFTKMYNYSLLSIIFNYKFQDTICSESLQGSCISQKNLTKCKRFLWLTQYFKNISVCKFSPCSGLILTVASKKSAQVESIDTYLKDRMNDYKKYKKMLSSEKIKSFENNYDVDHKGCKVLFCSVLSTNSFTNSF